MRRWLSFLTAGLLILGTAACTPGKTESAQSVPQSVSTLETTEKDGGEMEKEVFYIQVNEEIFTADFEDNSSARAFRNLLSDGPLTVQMRDYGHFEKVGDLGQSLPQNDTSITTVPGDVILYGGDSITIYYDTNSWTFTRLGKIRNATRENLLEVLGEGEITAVFSLENPDAQ